MKYYQLIFFSLLLSSNGLFAKHPTVPLLPPGNERGSASVSTTTTQNKITLQTPIQWGIELGILGREQESKNEILGFQIFMGGRATMRFRPFPYFYLRPSIGYFRRTESIASVSNTQSLIETGLNAQYALYSSRSTKLLVGISQRLDAYQSSLSVNNSSETTPWAFRYRIGPSVGTSFRFNDLTTLTLDGEYTFGLTGIKKEFSTLTIGLLFDL